MSEEILNTYGLKSLQGKLGFMKAWNIQQSKIDAKDKEIEELRYILNEALGAFECTQCVDNYPRDAWPRAAKRILTGDK